MSLNPNERIKIIVSIKKHVLKHHINVAGVSYDAWGKVVDERTPTLLTADISGFESGVQQLLSKLGSSHTVFYHGSGNEVLPQHSINATLRGVKWVTTSVGCSWTSSTRVQLMLLVSSRAIF